MVFPLRAAEVWPRLIEETVAGRTVPSLAHDDQALFLAAHGTKEGWRSLLWLCDFAEFLRRYQDLDWIAILERAARSHSSRQLLLAIELATTMLDAPAPAELIEKARNSSAVQSLARRARVRNASESSQRKLGITLRAQHPRQVSAQAVADQGVSDDTNRRRSPGNAIADLPSVLAYLTRPFRLASHVAKMFLSPLQPDLVDDHGPHELKIAEALAREQIGNSFVAYFGDLFVENRS